MSGVACWLLLVGLVDLFRAHDDETSRVRRMWLAGLGALGGVALAVSSEPSGRGVAAWIGIVVSVVGWVLVSGSALGRARRAPAGVLPPSLRLRVGAAYGTLVLGLAAALLGGPATGEPVFATALLDGSALADVAPAATLLVAGVVLVQVSTANIVIRLLLDLVGVPAHDNEKKLRGGRVLGPMERLVVVGLGVAGSLTAASLVIAAKALLRFPELRTTARGEAPLGGPSDVTEYFLVGSMASWLVALGGVALVALV